MIKQLWLFQCDLCYYTSCCPKAPDQQEPPPLPLDWFWRDGKLICGNRKCRAKVAESILPPLEGGDKS